MDFKGDMLRSLYRHRPFCRFANLAKAYYRSCGRRAHIQGIFLHCSALKRITVSDHFIEQQAAPIGARVLPPIQSDRRLILEKSPSIFQISPKFCGKWPLHLKN